MSVMGVSSVYISTLPVMARNSGPSSWFKHNFKIIPRVHLDGPLLRAMTIILGV
jgi:hypothetical protein